MNPRSWFGDLTGYFVYMLFIATLGPLLFGFHLSELNAPEDVIRCKKRSITATHVTTTAPTTATATATATPNLPQCIKMTPTQWGIVGSMYTLGGLVGALSAAPLAGKYGRLRAMQLTTLFFTMGPLFEALSPTMAVMAFGRLVSGVGAGASVVIVPLYISEIAPPANKGFFGAFTQIMCNVGILVTQLLGYFLSHDSYWRVILAVGGVIGLAQGLGLLLSAESPKYLAEKGNFALAKRTLRKIRGEHADIDGEMSDWGADGANVSEEEQTLLDNEGGSPPPASRSPGDQGSLTIMQVLRHPDYKKAAVAVIMVMLAQQFSGINSIVMYGVSLLAGLLESNSALLNLAVSAVNIVITAGGAPLPDKFGRKPCLLGSIAGMGISAFLLAMGIMNSVPVLSALAVLFFVSSFALGLGPVPFILASELVGPEAVDATQSIALGANWIATFLVAQFFPLLSAQLGGKVYLIFAALSGFFFGFLLWFVPETKGKKKADEVWGRERRVD